jgi:23S rRNA (cytidine1920-2'-O)/16S rRNA (cytidine1409-2'-O)-methyltransferase
MAARRPTHERIDVLLVERGLVESRARAHARIMAGDVVVDDRRVDKPGAKVDIAAQIRLKGEGMPWVSRGGLKLDKALDWFAVDAKARVCVDVGASTGGFTDVLLTRGAALVHAVDVGYGQLAHKLRIDPRVRVLERTHVKDLKNLDPIPTLAVIDTSFISLTLVLPEVARLLAPHGEVVALIKPQFEVGRGNVGKGGIVRDEAARATSVERVLACAAALGFTVPSPPRESPIHGADGNVEYVVAFAR